jgi:thioredoxin reductase
MPKDIYDTIIVGGGPAGLSAALLLGRCRRRVLVIDAGRGRNYAARHMHNFITRDGCPPGEIRTLARAELRKYGIRVLKGCVTRATCTQSGFRIRIDGKRTATSRTLLMATGVIDDLPVIPGLRELYGLGIHHCPYCDAWEHKDKPIAVYGPGRKGVGLGLNLLNWSRRVTVITDGRRLPPTARATANENSLAIREEKILRLEPRNPAKPPSESNPLARIIFARGHPLPVHGLFFNTWQVQRSRLPERLGCTLDENGGVLRDGRQRTGVPGLYLAGDASRDVQFVVVAAAEGAKAGVAINTDLAQRDRNAARNRRPTKH